MKYPELSLYPDTVAHILEPMDGDGRPIIWDEEGIPLNSDHYGEAFKANRFEEDYENCPDLIDWPEPKHTKVWANRALMARIYPHIPDMLGTAVDVNLATRMMIGMDDKENYTLTEGLKIVEGLHKAWSLYMYGPRRVENGALPAHVASLQRTLAGYSGMLTRQIFPTPLHLMVGEGADKELDIDELLGVMSASNGKAFVNEYSNERCPASRLAQTAMLECMFGSEKLIFDKYAEEYLRKADPKRRAGNWIDGGLGLGAPDTISALGNEVANVILNPMNVKASRDLWLMHRYLVGDRCPTVLDFVAKSTFGQA